VRALRTQLKDIPAAVYLRYGLLMLPELALLVVIMLIVRRWVELPLWLLVGLPLLWLIKDMVLFPFVWRAYDWDRPGISRRLIGERAIVMEPLDPEGYVQVGAELWKAECIGGGQQVSRGGAVEVVMRRGLKLFVRPAVEDNTDEDAA